MEPRAEKFNLGLPPMELAETKTTVRTIRGQESRRKRCIPPFLKKVITFCVFCIIALGSYFLLVKILSEREFILSNQETQVLVIADGPSLPNNYTEEDISLFIKLHKIPEDHEFPLKKQKTIQTFRNKRSTRNMQDNELSRNGNEVYEDYNFENARDIIANYDKECDFNNLNEFCKNLLQDLDAPVFSLDDETRSFNDGQNSFYNDEENYGLDSNIDLNEVVNKYGTQFMIDLKARFEDICSNQISILEPYCSSLHQFFKTGQPFYADLIANKFLDAQYYSDTYEHKPNEIATSAEPIIKRQSLPTEDLEMITDLDNIAMSSEKSEIVSKTEGNSNFNERASFDIPQPVYYENLPAYQPPPSFELPLYQPPSDCLLKRILSSYYATPPAYASPYQESPPSLYYPNQDSYGPLTYPGSAEQRVALNMKDATRHPQDVAISLEKHLTTQPTTLNGHQVKAESRDAECPSGTIPCRFGETCIVKSAWCDGMVDCPDASDEAQCTCKFRVHKERLCDGYYDCPFGEDEMGCFGCNEEMFSCGNLDLNAKSTCFTKEQRCNNIPECPNQSDEMECNILSPNLHNKPMFSVSNTEGFLQRNYLGKWYPVCKNPYMWAHEACLRETGLILRPPFIQAVKIDPSFQISYVNNGLGGFVHKTEQCLNSSAIYITCPDMLCGTRVPVTMQSLRDLAGQKTDFFGRNKRELYLPSEVETLDSHPGMFDLLNQYGRESRLKRFEGRVVGGKASQPAAWPWVVGIYMDGRFHCGGVLINNRWVVSAAHCVHEFWNHYYEIQVGMLRRFSFSPQEINIRVSHVIVNKYFNKMDMRNDLSLLRLEEPVHFSRWVRPICLPGPDTAGPNWKWGPSAGTLCTAVGWGATKEHGADPDHLREVEVPMWSHCKHREDVEGKEICAGPTEGGKDACQGDSGGPLLCRNPLNPKQWYMAGIVSHGEGCARKGEPGVYTRASLFVDWINFHVGSQNLPGITPKQECPGFRCESGLQKCLPQRRVCDKIVDCLHAEDELNCDFMRSANEKINSSSEAVNEHISDSNFNARAFDISQQTTQEKHEFEGRFHHHKFIKVHPHFVHAHPVQQPTYFVPVPQYYQVPAEPITYFNPNKFYTFGRASEDLENVETNQEISVASKHLHSSSNTKPILINVTERSMTVTEPHNDNSDLKVSFNTVTEFISSTEKVSPETKNIEGNIGTTLSEMIISASSTESPIEKKTDSSIANAVFEDFPPVTELQTSERPIIMNSITESVKRGDTVPESSLEQSNEKSEVENLTPEAEHMAPSHVDSMENTSSFDVDEHLSKENNFTNLSDNVDPLHNTSIESETDVSHEFVSTQQNQNLNTTSSDESVTKIQLENKNNFNDTPALKNIDNIDSKSLPFDVASDISDANQSKLQVNTINSTIDDNSKEKSSILIPALRKRIFTLPEIFECRRLAQSIRYSLRCDHKADCEDGSDEMDCTCEDYLATFEPAALCNGFVDCSDGTDEADCNACNDDYFLCRRSHECLPEKFVCDGVPQCPDSEDELDCLSLSNGKTLSLDLDGRPHIHLEGFLSKRHLNHWNVICQDDLPVDIQEQKAQHICHYLGFSGANRYQIRHVNFKDLEDIEPPSIQRSRRNINEVPIDFIYKSSQRSADDEKTIGQQVIQNPQLIPIECVPNITKICMTLYVHCEPTLFDDFSIHRSLDTNSLLEEKDENIDLHAANVILEDKSGYLWPWNAKIFVNGILKCSGVLITLDAVMIHQACLWDTSLTKDYVSVILGTKKKISQITEPFEQTIEAINKIDLFRSDVTILKLKSPCSYSRMVRPMVIPSFNIHKRNSKLCVVVGPDDEDKMVPVMLREMDTDCGHHNRCFARTADNPDCVSGKAAQREWNGIISCRSREGWFPAAAYKEAKGQCGFMDLFPAFDIAHLRTDLKHTLGKSFNFGGSSDIIAPDCSGTRCPRGKCIPMRNVCDGVKHCEDGSDEMEQSCTQKHLVCSNKPLAEDCGCKSNQIKCRNLKCIDKELFGNGKDDCGDNSDEPNSISCGQYLARVSPDRVCDGHLHCEDRSDEDPGFCKCFSNNTFECRPRRENVCVGMDLVCDGVNDCPGGEDERLCLALGAADGSPYGQGEVIVNRNGKWHTKCYHSPNHTKTDVENICKELGFISGHALLLKSNEKPEINPHTNVVTEPFTEVVLNNLITLRLRNKKGSIARAVVENEGKNCFSAHIECT